ncbi:MAG: metallophosphoesterase [Chitinophagaceae bacterium]|nr:metallophosphoesterase [Chitinophagaceae bacterium]MBK9570417.1 metallophosphoesterase [Chitinophagaceae bacterium]MBL0131231.1 metallophosphoesterase [Chitinophagaceae bacterium]MBL0273183.1 metallophosphoesterase [Chitinophagaceae bacterium]
MKKFTISVFPFLLAAAMIPKPVFYESREKVAETMQLDGPYVIYRNEQLFTHYVFDNDGIKSVKTDSMPLAKRSGISLTVATDIPGKTFTVQLKPTLENEKTEFPKVKKLFIVSDIEGNFSALRKLLQANGVIDKNFNWSFGNGHLVLTGDFFDRGSQVTEVLWLIYSLEEKAKKMGGYIHFVLGNHEIMNLSGDIRYVQPKYFENAALLNENYMTLYSENSELGKWLRTKNIMERIGDILFIHGGISAAVNRMDIPVSKVNKLARPYYADSSYIYSDPKIDTLYSDWGPFWYRGYYTGNPKAPMTQIDSTLSLYGVKHIATGHTIVSDTISVLYDGKVFNTDVHHAKGHTEALLIEEGKYYRVNEQAEKFLIHK